VKAILSIIVGAIGLLISSCGLLFLVGGGTGGGYWPVAVPFVIIGGLMLWGAVALWRSWRKAIKQQGAKPLPDNARPPN